MGSVRRRPRRIRIPSCSESTSVPRRDPQTRRSGLHGLGICRCLPRSPQTDPTSRLTPAADRRATQDFGRNGSYLITAPPNLTRSAHSGSTSTRRRADPEIAPGREGANVARREARRPLAEQHAIGIIPSD